MINDLNSDCPISFYMTMVPTKRSEKDFQAVKRFKREEFGVLSPLLLDHGLPLALPLSDGASVDLGLDLRPPLSHVVLNVKNERVLAEVCVHHLAWRLKADGRVQVWLQRTHTAMAG